MRPPPPPCDPARFRRLLGDAHPLTDLRTVGDVASAWEGFFVRELALRAALGVYLDAARARLTANRASRGAAEWTLWVHIGALADALHADPDILPILPDALRGGEIPSEGHRFAEPAPPWDSSLGLPRGPAAWARLQGLPSTALGLHVLEVEFDALPGPFDPVVAFGALCELADDGPWHPGTVLSLLGRLHLEEAGRDPTTWEFAALLVRLAPGEPELRWALHHLGLHGPLAFDAVTRFVHAGRAAARRAETRYASLATLLPGRAPRRAAPPSADARAKLAAWCRTRSDWTGAAELLTRLG